MSKEKLEPRELLSASDEELYACFCENEPIYAPDVVRKCYRNLTEAIDEYAEAKAKWMFALGFKCAIRLLSIKKEGEDCEL